MLPQIECSISGRVQNVLFRDFATRKARGLGLVGTAENLPDGTVRVIAQGKQEELDKYVIQLKRGSMFSRVDSVSVKWSNSERAFPDFSIKY